MPLNLPDRVRLTVSTAVISAVVCLHPLQASAQDAEAGLALARENCAECHAVTAIDDSTHKAAPPFREVVKRYPPSNLAEALVEGIATGHPDMPEFEFSATQANDLIAHLESLLPPAAKSTD